jgi:hypothetical protein
MTTITSIPTLHKHQLLNQLLGLVREQRKALEAEDLDRFLALLDEREAVIADLSATDSGVTPANVVPFPAMTPSNVSTDVEMAMRRLLRTILTEDEENVHLLHTQMDDLKDALERTARNRVAGGGYATAMLGGRIRSMVDRVC